jgi:hypothetical protein
MMDSRLDEYREFFDEVVDELAHAEEVAESEEQATPEQKVRWEHEMNQFEGELRERPPDPKDLEEETPEQFRQAIEREPAEQLLMHRRFNAKAICKCMARGHSHHIAARMLLEASVWRLQIMDCEIERRHLNTGSIPPGSPDDTIDDS